MKHFIDARLGSVAALSHPDLPALAEKSCLIVDLQGKMRVLAKLKVGADADALRNKLTQIVAPAADVYWSNEVWIEEERPAPAKRAVFESAWREAKAEPPGQDGVFVLDRRLSKDAWLDAPFEPPWHLNDHTPPVISFYSFKGGVGRTTAVAAVAINAARSGKRVVVVDFDLEAPGVGSILASPGDPAPDLGVIDYLLERRLVPADALDISEFYQTSADPAVVKEGEPIHVVAAGKLDNWYLEKLARINYEFLYASAAEAGATESPLHQLLKSLRAKLKPDLILVDSRAGFHDLGGLSLSGIAHLQVLFGLNSAQSWAGLSLVVAHLGKEMVLSGKAQRGCAMVQTLAPPQEPSRKEHVENFKERSFEVFSENYYDPPGPDGEWPMPDPEAAESPHFPAVLTWDNRVFGYSSVASVVDYLCEGEYRNLAAFILDKVGRTLE